ncbi:MAG TPA: hypothetical protein VIB39_22165 [Candidatus Angelobacter sp.]
MKRQAIITAIIAFGMGICQAQVHTPPAPMQSGNGPVRGNQQQQQSSVGGVPGLGTPSSTDTAPQSFKGCVSGSSGSWNLTTDKGKNLVLSGADAQISPYTGHEVRISGVQASDGTVSINTIDQLPGSCPNETASNTATQSSNATSDNSATSTTTSSTESTATTQPPATATTPESSGAMSGQSTSPAGNNPGTTTPPVTNQTPANTVGSGQTAQPTTQPPATGNAPEANAAGNNAEQSSNPGVRKYSDMDQNASKTGSSAGDNAQKLPQTASPLPLLGLFGLGSLAAGLIGRRNRK